MSLKSLGRSFEKRLLRPLFQKLKRRVRVPGAHDRISRLETRLEELESLFREQAGLHYLRIAEDVDSTPHGEESARGRRIA